MRTWTKFGFLITLQMVCTLPGWAQPTCTGNIQVRNTDNNTVLGFLASHWNTFGEYDAVVPSTSSVSPSALTVMFTYTPGAPFSLTASNGPDNTYPLVGWIVGFASTSDNLSPGSHNYAYLGGTTATPPNSRAVAGANAFTNATGIPEDIESAIWSVSPTLALTPQWVNTDASKPATFAVTSTGIFVVTGDTTAFQNTFGPATNVAFTFVPAPMTACVIATPTLSVAKAHVGTFIQGSTGEWDVTVNNTTASSVTSGTTTVFDTLPSGYTINSFSTTDASWSCSGTGTQTATCTSTMGLNGGSSFPVIRMIVNIPANSPASVTNTAKAFGGGDTTHTSLATAASGSDPVVVMQVPASVTATAGTPQSTAVNTAFPINLQATVRDAGSVGLPNVNVTFQAPGSGPSGTFGLPCSGITCVVPTNAMGVATAPTFTANGTPGSYHVTATVPGLMPAIFALTNVGPPTFTKTIATPFGAGSINQGDTTAVAFTVSNPNSIALTGLSFTDPLPSGLWIQNPNGLSNTCGGTVTAVPGTGTISLTGGAVSATSTCSISVNVTGVASGDQTNPSVTLTSNEAPSATSAPANVFVEPWWLWFFY
jgi:hypothetical protein